MGLDTYGGGVLLVLGSAILAVIGLLIARKVIDLDRLRASHDVGGYLLSVVGTLYAVLLGLVVVDAMSKFSLAREVTEREANCLADVYVLAECLPEKKRDEVRAICVNYASAVIDTEWDDMDEGAYCPVAHKTAVDLMQSLMNFEPVSENQKALFPLIVADAGDMWKARRQRINMALNGIDNAEWFTLIVGGAITIFFTFFFGLENLKLQIAMTAMVAVLISLNVYLVALFGYPFSGDLKIGTDSFRIDQGIFDNRVGLRTGAGVH